MTTLEPLDQGGLTMHWDEIESCIRASVKDCDMTVANVQGALRSKSLLAWAVWIEGKVRAIALTKPVEDNYSGGRAMLVYGLHSSGMEMEQWQETASMFEEVCRKTGFAKIMANTEVAKILDVVGHLGWHTQTVCWKELS